MASAEFDLLCAFEGHAVEDPGMVVFSKPPRRPDPPLTNVPNRYLAGG